MNGYRCGSVVGYGSECCEVTVVSRIYAPPFATLALVENVGGGLYAGSDILSREYAPSSGATPRC